MQDMDYFGLAEHVARCEDGLREAEGPARLRLLAELCWYLRQRDGQRALALADEADALLVRSVFPDPRERVRIEARLILVRAGDKRLSARLPEAMALLTLARDRFEEVEDFIGVGDALILEASILTDMGRSESLMGVYSRAKQAFRRVGDAIREAYCEGRVIEQAAYADRAGTGARMQEIVARLGAPEHPGLLAWVELLRALACANAEDFGATIRHCQRAYDLNLTAGQRHPAIIVACNIAQQYASLNDHAQALEWVERALELARQTRWPTCIGTASFTMGAVLRGLGRYEAARGFLLNALEVYPSSQGSRDHLLCSKFYGQILLGLEEFDEALKVLVEVVRSAREVDAHSEIVIEGLYFQASALNGLRRPREALACAEEALALARERRILEPQVGILRAFADIARDHRFPVPARSNAASAPIHYLQEALRVARDINGYTIPDDLLSQLSVDFEAVGDLASALACARQAAESRDRTHTKKANDLATVMQVRLETELAHADAAHHRALAASEGRRAVLLQAANATLERLAVIGQEITASLDVETVFQTLHRHVGALLDASSVSIWMLETDVDGRDVLRLRFGLEGDTPLPPLRVPLDDPDSTAARCVRERREILLEVSNGQLAPGHVEGTVPMNAAYFAPLVAVDDVLGVLSIQSDREHAYGERERLILRTVTAYGAVALANARNTRDAAEARAELEREKMGTVLIHAGKLMTVGRLASGVVHEMAHPLATLGLLTEEVHALHAQGRGGEATQAAARLDREVKRLHKLLRRLRDFARSDPPRVTEHDMHALLADAKLLFLSRLSAANVSYREDVQEIRVRVDPERFCLAIANIMFNAIDAMRGQKHPQILLSVRAPSTGEATADDPAGAHDMVELRIRDTGPGLSLEALEHLFEPFFTTKPPGEGLGLGLALSAESLGSIGGRMSAANHPAGGAEFVLRLPRA